MTLRPSIALALGFGIALAPVALAQEPAPPPALRRGMIAPALKFARPAVPPPGPSGPPPPPAPATSPTTVTLDFKAKAVGEVIRGLGERSGGQVELFNLNDPRWNEQKVTLESAAPVPLWDAVDRLSAAAPLQRSVTWAGPLGGHRPRIQFQANFGYGLYGNATASDIGPAAYVGPFRLGTVLIHEHFERVFRRPKGASAADETPPFYVDIPIVAEPSIVWNQTGPLRGLEAVDDAGQSLLDPKLAGGELPWSASMVEVHGPPKNLRVPLVRGPKPSKALATLRGVLPVEVARRPTAPTKVVPLAGVSGQTFRDGDLALEVREYKVEADGKAVVKLTARIEGPRGDLDPKRRRLLDARLWSIFYHQLEPMDAQGRTVNLSGNSRPNPAGGLDMDYSYTPAPPGSKPYPPTSVRIYRPDWAAWDLPIAFKDLPLP
jgi:hypothetical protein